MVWCDERPQEERALPWACAQTKAGGAVYHRHACYKRDYAESGAKVVTRDAGGWSCLIGLSSA